MLKDAAVANICEVEEDIDANWLHVVLLLAFCLLAEAEDIFLVLGLSPRGGRMDEVDVEEEDEDEDEVGEVEYNLFTLFTLLS